MYSYKINNSYTIYVNYAYLNECVKVCKQREKSSKSKPTRVCESNSTKRRNVVRVGSKVSVMDIETQKEITFTIVYSENVDVANDKISDTSPIGKALIGHGIGEFVEVKIPSGLMKYKVKEIK